jgi:adenylate cyclase, class 2
MPVINFEFKARCADIIAAEKKLLTLDPAFAGEDNQTDTYFNVPDGRLKLREGNIENALIFYKRENTAGAKLSTVLLYQHQPDASLKDILTASLGIKVVVAKKRRIYFIENVKFHFDSIAGLGTFAEVEAIDRTGDIGLEKLKEQCSAYADLLGIQPEDYIAHSYSDMLMEKQ